MRHAPYPIGVEERNAWVRHMTEAIAEADLPDELASELLAYFDHAATHMINQVR
jgi:hemoglobin